MKQILQISILGVFILTMKAGLVQGGETLLEADYNNAKESAIKLRLPIAIFLTSRQNDVRMESSDPTWVPIWNNPNERYFSAFGKKCIVIRINERDESLLRRLPKNIREQLESPKTGKGIPKIMLIDPDNESIIAIFPHEKTTTFELLLKTALGKYQAEKIKNRIDAEELKDQTREFILTRGIDAFDPKNPSLKIGGFAAGSKLVVEKKTEFAGYSPVTFTTPDGHLIKALCQKNDLE